MNRLRYIIENGQIVNDTGALKIFYNFAENQDELPKISILGFEESNKSGELFTYSYQMGSSALAEISIPSGMTGDGYINLFGSRYSQDSGIASYIKIHNSEDLYTGQEFTYIFEGGKIPRDYLREISDYTGFDTQIPVHNKEIIFSNIDGSGLDYEGWEFGLNGANLPYFRARDIGGQSIPTFSEKIPYGENIWSIRYNNGSISISRYDQRTSGIISTNANIDRPLVAGGDWYINSGANGEIYPIDTGMGSSQTSSMRLRKFVYLDEYLNDFELATAIGAISEEVETGLDIIDSGINYETTCNEEYFETSGIIYTTGILTGYATEEIIVSGDPIFEPLYGEVGYLEQKLEECAENNELFITELETGIGGSAITGYDISWDPTGYEVVTPLYERSGVSGVVSSGYNTICSAEETPWYESGIVETIQTGRIDLLYPRSMSFMGDRFGNDFIEKQSAPRTYSGGEKIVNGVAQKIASSYHEGVGLSTNPYDRENADKLNLYLNGLSIRRGTGEETTREENGSVYPFYEIDKDYILDENQEIFIDAKFTGIDESLNLHGVYDIGPDQNEEVIFKIEGSKSGNYLTPYTNIDSLWVKYTGEEKYFGGISRVDSGCYMSRDKKLVITKGMESDRIYAMYYWDEDFLNGVAYPSGSAGIGQQPWEITWKYWNIDGYFTPKQVGEYNGEKTISSTSQYTGAFTEISPSGIKESSSDNPDKLYVWNSNSEEVNGAYSYAGDFSNRKLWMKENIEIFYGPYGDWFMAKAPYMSEDTYAHWAETGYYPTGVPDYLGDGISERITLTPIETFEKDIFLNGIKLYEGIDYVSTSGFFEPSGSITGVTGIYYSHPRISGVSVETGIDSYDKYEITGFEEDSVAIWINGVRKSPEECIYHDVYVDLISGRDLDVDVGDGVFKGTIG